MKQRGNELRFVIDGAADEAPADASLLRLIARVQIVRKRLVDDRASIDDVTREKNLRIRRLNLRPESKKA